MFKVLIASGKTKRQRPVAGALVSVLAHGALLSTLLLGSRPAIRVASEFEERIAAYLFPKDRAPAIGDESTEYVHVAGSGTGASRTGERTGTTAVRVTPPKPPDPLVLQPRTPEGGTGGTSDLIAQQQQMAESMGAFALLDVDSGAVRDPRSAAPAYPPDMEAKGIEGVVRARFVVDSTGRVDLSTLRVLDSTNAAFARAVRTAMPLMRFRPAMVGSRAVRQLSEQSFAFRVERRDTSVVRTPR